MSKYRALILTVKGPAVFDLGQHDDFDHAAAFANEFCERKNKEISEAVDKARSQLTAEQREQIEDPPSTEVVWILDNEDYRRLAGTVICPLGIAAKEKREETAIEAPVRHGVEEEADEAEG